MKGGARFLFLSIVVSFICGQVVAFTKAVCRNALDKKDPAHADYYCCEYKGWKMIWLTGMCFEHINRDCPGNYGYVVNLATQKITTLTADCTEKIYTSNVTIDYYK